VIVEDQPLSRDERDLQEGYAGSQHEPHAQDVPQGVQHLPKDVVSPCRVSWLSELWHCLFFALCRWALALDFVNTSIP